MSLDHEVKKKGSVAQVRLYDDEDLSKARFWIHVLVPVHPAQNVAEPLNDKFDRIFLGIGASPKLGELDRYRLAALHYARELVNAEIGALEKA